MIKDEYKAEYYKNMVKSIKETNLTLRLRNYNGDYGIGSVFNNEFNIIVKQLSNYWIVNKQIPIIKCTSKVTKTL